MKMLKLAAALAAVMWVAACASPSGDASGEAAEAPAETQAEVVTARAEIEPLGDSTLSGSATFTEEQGEVTMVLEVRNASPGEHAFHLHEIGDCSAPDGTSAGGHWNPTAQEHGQWGHDSFHLGDVGNLIVGEDGTGRISLTTDMWSIGTGQTDDVVGRSVIVHEKADDFTTQPTGAAGGRIGCGVIAVVSG